MLGVVVSSVEIWWHGGSQWLGALLLIAKGLC
jgi:hypothetical protein